MGAFILLCFATFLSSCTPGKPGKPPEPRVLLEQKAEIYHQGMLRHQDQYGFITTGSHELFYSCLAHAAGAPVDFLQAEKAPGVWHQHPDSLRLATAKDLSALLLCLWKLGRHDRARAQAVVSRFIAYEEKAEWALGNSPAPLLLKEKFLEMQAYFRGDKAEPEVTTWAQTRRGLASDEVVILLLLEGFMQGGLSKDRLAVLGELRTSNPENALYSAVTQHFLDGDQREAMSLLLNGLGEEDTPLFPADRLPTNKDYCAIYLFEYAQDPDELSAPWAPCLAPGAQEIERPGVDFMFVFSVIGSF